jgi:alcohol dehydrogenase class IV
MQWFRCLQPTEVLFGAGRIAEIGAVTARFGRRPLLVTRPATSGASATYARVLRLLKEAGLDAAHFEGVQPNPTTDTITAGADLARRHGADVVVGLGGGSSIDTAKAIAVEATHPGTAWDYLYRSQTQPGPATLPIVAATTLAGSGAHVTQVAVLTNAALREKSALYNTVLFPRVALVDPELALTASPRTTATSGFDILAHAFESCLHPGSSPYTQLLAHEALERVIRDLPGAVVNGRDLGARSSLAWGDTLAGIAIANAGVTLPHGIAMAMGGMYPHVAHGQALAAIYPAIARYTRGVATSTCAVLARLLDPALAGENDDRAAEACDAALDRFLQRIGLRASLVHLQLPREELPALASASLVLPDYRNHPRVATAVDVERILEESFALPAVETSR